MRFRLLRRRLTISAPRMAVRSALPWPFRWAVLAIVMGFCAAIGLWAFEFGKDIAGLEKGSKDQLMRLHAQVIELQTELATVKTERDQAQSVANTAGTLVTTERTTQEQVAGHVKQLEMENQSLRDDLGFFEKLIPASGVDGLAIRGLHAELQGDGRLKWQVLVIQSGKNPPEFNGRLELTFSGVLDGKPWSAALPGELPAAHVQVKGFSAKVMDGATVKATQSIKL